jgi:hypothetical protein
MPDWFTCVALLFQFACGIYCGHLIGHKRGRALTPNDELLRDLVRQRDRMMRERDEALRERTEANAAANHFAALLEHMSKTYARDARAN